MNINVSLLVMVQRELAWRSKLSLLVLIIELYFLGKYPRLKKIYPLCDVLLCHQDMSHLGRQYWKPCLVIYLSLPSRGGNYYSYT